MKQHPISFNFRDNVEYGMVRGLVRHFLRSILKENYKMMEIAVNEAVNNALQFGGKKENCCLRLDVINGRKLVVRVRQGGLGFSANSRLAGLRGRPVPNRDENGRGLFIMTAAVDYLRYNRQGTEVIMVKKIL